MVWLSRTLLLLTLVMSPAAGAVSAQSAIHLADSLYDAQRFDSALVVYQRILDSEVFGDSTLGYLNYRLGACQLRTGQTETALRSLEHASDLYAEALGADHELVGQAKNAIGLALKILGQYDNALEAYEQSLAIKVVHSTDDSVSVSKTLNNIAAIYLAVGRPSDAATVLQRVAGIRRRALGPDHIDYGLSLVRIGDIFRMACDYTKADSLISLGTEVVQSSSDCGPRDSAEVLNTHANLRREQGSLSEAANMFAAAARHYQAAGEAGEFVAIENLALVLRESGDYLRSEQKYAQLLKRLNEQALPDNHQIARLEEDLGCLYTDMGRYEDASSSLASALSRWQQLGEHFHEDESRCRNNLAHLYLLTGDDYRAEEQLRTSIDILLEVSSPPLLQLATTLETLAWLYLERDQCDKADSVLAEAIGMIKSRTEEELPLTAYLLVTKADAAICLGDYATARAYLDDARLIYAETYGQDHPELIRLRSSYSCLYFATNQPDSALAAAWSAFELQRDQFGRTVIGMSERDALQFADGIRNAANLYMTMAMRSGNRRDPERVLEVVSAAKRAVGDVVMTRRKLARRTNDAEFQALLSEYRATSNALAARWQNPSNDGESDAALDSLKDALYLQERTLARLGLDLHAPEATAGDVLELRDAMPDGSVAVDYYHYWELGPRGDSVDTRLLALVIPSTGSLRLVDLGTAEDIQKLVQSYRDHMTALASGTHLPKSTDLSGYQLLARELYEALLGPMDDALSDCNMLFIAPDAELNLVGFAGLPDSRRRYLVERMPVHYLGSLRDLKIPDRQEKASGKMLALGDPDYDADVASRTGAQTYSHHQRFASDAETGMNLRSGCGDLATLDVKPLPHTSNEVDRIVALWQSEGAGDISVLKGPAASEDSLKAYAPGCEILHLATHGYFLEGRCGSGGQAVRSGSQTVFAGENPLLLSGLLLAGANLHGAGADSAGMDDGILTALEVSAMDLDATRLVVLSACETGLGRIQAGEGVYGLRRAFQTAGADAVVSSLWAVPDKQAGQQLAQLYQSAGTLPERLRKAQLNLLEELRDIGLPPHPFLWAGFVSFGDWRN